MYCAALKVINCTLAALTVRPWMFQVGLASGLGQYTEVVREAQKGLRLRNVRYVDAMGLPFQDGHLHLNTQAQVQLGHMLAQSYLDYGTSTH